MKKTTVLLTALCALSSVAHAGSTEDVAALMKSDFPNVNVQEVRPTPLPYIFEVDVNNNGRNLVMYTDSSATYFFTSMIDARKQLDISAKRAEELNKTNFADLPLQNAIKTVYGNGKRKVAVFVDPDCGYCKKLEAEIQSLTDVTVYTFLVSILGPSSHEKAESIWCSSNQSQSLQKVLIEKSSLAVKKCANPLTENGELFRQRGFQGTPSLIFSDGTSVPGFITAEAINKKLGE